MFLQGFKTVAAKLQEEFVAQNYQYLTVVSIDNMAENGKNSCVIFSILLHIVSNSASLTFLPASPRLPKIFISHAPHKRYENSNSHKASPLGSTNLIILNLAALFQFL